MAQQDTNQLIQQDPNIQPQDPLAGTADTSSSTAGVQPVTTQTEPTPPPEAPAPQTQEAEGIQTAAPTTFEPTLNIPGALSEITPEQTVAGQIEKITAAESPLMIAAKTRAQQAAQQRGLGQSTLAIEAGQKALYEAALPIAQADAATAAGRANQLLQSYTQSGLSAQEATQQSELLIQEAVNRGLLSQQEAGQAIEQIQVAGQIEQDQIALRAQLDRDNAEYMARLQEELGADDKAQAVFADYSKTVESLATQRSAILTQIQSQPGLSGAEKVALINQVNVQFQEDVANMNELYSTNPLWDADWQMIGTVEPTVEGSTQASALQNVATATAVTDAREASAGLVGAYNSSKDVDTMRPAARQMLAAAKDQKQSLLEQYGQDAADQYAAWWESRTGTKI